MLTYDAVALFLESRAERGLSPSTIYLYEWALSKLRQQSPNELPTTQEEVQRAIHNHSHLSAASQRTIWERLRVFWIWLQTRGLTTSNPMVEIPSPLKRRKLPRVLSKAEIRNLLQTAHSERDATVIATLLDTGLRVGELASLTKDAAQPNGLTVCGKVGQRIVPVSPGIYDLLHRQGDGDHVWVGQKGPLTASGLQQIVRRTMRRAGFQPPKIGPHALRHTFGVQWMLGGGDLSSLQSILGHSKVETTMIYAAMGNKLLSQQHRKFSPMRGVRHLAHSIDGDLR